MYRTIFAALLSTTLSLSGPAAVESQGHGGGPKPKPPTSHGPKTHAPKPVAPGHGSPRTTHGASATTTHGNTSAKGHTTTTGTATTTTHLTAVQQKLQKNTNLATKLGSRLPGGTDLMTASEGFRNLGQFVAAVNVSNNLDIPFTQLKSRMVDDNMSLGQSIQDLRPRADSKVEVRRAESDADVLIRTSADTASTGTKKKTKPANSTARKRG